MKLRNKLIPLASCLAIGATVAPMATACATSEFVDLTDGFTPTISKLAVEGNKLTASKAEQVYFNAVSENPEIFAQDLNWTISTALRTAAENPNNIFEDDTAETSVLNYAKQSVKNIKVGKTTIPHYTKESPTVLVDEEFYTLSFDLVREQQYTWKHDVEVVSGQPTVQGTVVGTTMLTLSVKNVPMNFNMYSGKFSSNKLSTSGDRKRRIGEFYSPHLGRGLFNPEWYDDYSILDFLEYIKTNWFLTSGLILDLPNDPGIYQRLALIYMVDPWEVSYEYKTSDTYSYVYNDIAESYTNNTSAGGTYDDYRKIYYDDTAAEELMYLTIGSHYLGDVAYEKE